MASNQKRGFLYIYKAGITGNHHQRKKDEDNQGKKSNSSRSWLQRLTRTRNSSNAEKIVIEEGGFVEARNSTSCLELGGGGGGEGFVEGRKSVSKGVIFEERRKSVSQIEGDFGGVEKVVVDEGRKSVSQIETLSSVAAYLQVKVLVSDMPSFMQLHAFRSARRTFDSLEQFSSKHIAHNIKKEFDKAYGPVWHCIVGSSFGSFVTHATGCFLYFSMENLYILLFKTKVKKTLGKGTC
ncbi:hypothetical protein HN51_057531 [Arachis hypogaea]|uniref:Dynein light chain n=1 Tax=Arachis hypogaea TaxID=3818 RepID=A0A444WX84_ARAHY|nr:uncharacterized protein LOC107621778 [Arachis ipaensis]XP_025684482.1 uncharacterized protein LOC112785242 [Arachis hypogaea]QHN80602.1 Dynein light chain, cytoplasmic [Arachis hypogaea]RYQ82076.1 hypothetical protein Ahy_B10g100654 [Arachis hypogaea]